MPLTDQPLRLFNAGLHTSNFQLTGTVARRLTEVELAKRVEGGEYMLESYHYIHRQTMVDKIRASGDKVFLDSGAFSALTQGTAIDLNGYCDYIHKNQDIILNLDGVMIASVLDEIGYGHKAAEQTWKNQQAMEAQGVRPLPCFHAGEPLEFLDHYIENYEYITLGGLVGGSTKGLQEWLDVLWERLTDDDGYPKLKVHGFGITSLPLMLRYPWYSVDSSTWVQWSANGLILEPQEGRQLTVSDKSSARKVAGQHLRNVSEVEQGHLCGVIESQGGEVQRLEELYYARWAWNCWAFPQYMKLRDDTRCKQYFRQKGGLFF